MSAALARRAGGGRRALRAAALLCCLAADAAEPGAGGPCAPSVACSMSGEFSRRGADGCLGCHDEEEPFPTLALFRTVHGHPQVPGSPFDRAGDAALPAGLQCEACHGPEAGHGRRLLADGRARPPILNFGARGNADPALENAMCLACHQTYGRAHWAGSAHELAGLACADCHRIHGADEVRAHETQSETCGTCHRNVIADALKLSSHPMREGQLVCRDCHDPHGGRGEALTVAATPGQTCLACHADKRGPFLWEHPPAVEDCGICHEPHGANQPALLVRRAPQLCQGCHSSVGHRSLPQLAASLPPGPASEFLLANACLNCHSAVHGSNHPSGDRLRR